MKQIRINGGQTLEDISLREYGCLEGVMLILDDNGLSLDDELQEGQLILIRETVPNITGTNLDIYSQLKELGVSPNSGMVTQAQPNQYVNQQYVEDNYIE